MTGTPGLILAGGSSRRMPGASKLERDWGDTSVLGAVVRVARAAGLRPVVVVCRTDVSCPAAAAAADARVSAPPGGGRADSLAAGLGALPPGPVVVLLGDEPGVRSEVVSVLAERCREEEVDAGRVRYGDRAGHPVWLGPAARERAAGLTGDASVWDAVARPPLRLLELEIEGPAPIDVDTPAALARARRRRGGA